MTRPLYKINGKINKVAIFVLILFGKSFFSKHRPNPQINDMIGNDQKDSIKLYSNYKIYDGEISSIILFIES